MLPTRQGRLTTLCQQINFELALTSYRGGGQVKGFGSA
jgi:hypothetical protein